jgi:hypothetical protein
MQLHELIAVLIQTGLVVMLPGLPAVPAVRQRSWRLFLLGVPKMIAGVYLLLGFFVFSAALTPEWKGAAKLGWLSCFCVGKLVLLPLVLWATASFYAWEVFQAASRLRPWIVLGYFSVPGLALMAHAHGHTEWGETIFGSLFLGLGCFTGTVLWLLGEKFGASPQGK